VLSFNNSAYLLILNAMRIAGDRTRFRSVAEEFDTNQNFKMLPQLSTEL